MNLAPGAGEAPPSSAAEARAVLRGVTLGVRAGVSPELDERWRAVGIYHVLSVSGLHLAVVALLAFSALRRGAAALGLRGDPARVALVPALALALAYSMLTGAEIATLRALVVAALWMSSAALGRPLRLLDALGLAALLLLAWAPAQLWQPSFQLSFAAALALALGPKLALAPPATASRLLRALHRAARWATAGLVSSAWVALVTAPITAYHFQQVQPGGILGNLVITPLLELAALPLGLLGLGLGELSASAGAAMIAAAASVITFADGLARMLQLVCPVGEVAIAAPSLAALLWLFTTALCALRGSRRAFYLGCLVLALLWRAAPLAPPDGVRVTFFDVGQGDAALIETASQLWLIDAGGAPGARTAQGAAAPGRAIVQYLRLLRRRRIDVAIVSHPHPDHYLGLLALTQAEVQIDELWLVPGFVESALPWSAGEAAASLPFARVVAELARAGTQVRPPPPHGRRSQEQAQLSVLAPRLDDAAGRSQLAADPVRSVNDNSAVVTLAYAGRRVLFPGDVELEGEEALVTQLPAAEVRAEVVKVPHHGSRTSSSAALVRATGATLVVISCGAGNRFGFPAPEVLERWRVHGAEVARTDRGGAVRLEISPRGALALTRP